MNVEFNDIKDYLENKEDCIYLEAYWYSIIIGVLLILVVFISSCYKKNLYYKNILMIQNDMIILNIDYEDLGLIIDNNQIIIDDYSYDYQVLDVNILNASNLSCEIRIFINEYINFDNKVFYQYKILLKEESILEYLVRVVKGE